jgi:hypothetical protein
VFISEKHRNSAAEDEKSVTKTIFSISFFVVLLDVFVSDGGKNFSKAI